ncbi:MAG: MBL fold metallo-hydrolase [Acidobacteria bacterium]|nr:MBL fold metallo-hydrolase [Acidobacteriota bacterium]
MPATEATLTILVDNEAAPPLAAEHGFALWIEAAGRRILFDTGQGGALAGNAGRLGVDLSAADTFVLSHGHYDHGGGIPAVLTLNPDISVFAHPHCLRRRFVVSPKETRAVGLPDEATAALRRHHSVTWLEAPALLEPDVGLTGPVARATAFEDTGGPFFLDRDGRRADPLDDDLALWIRTSRGLVVCVGCAHAGAINTVRQAQARSGSRELLAVIGGFHLGAASAARMAATIAALRELDPRHLVPCHCTGRAASETLRAMLGDRVAPGAAGQTFRF